MEGCSVEALRCLYDRGKERQHVTLVHQSPIFKKQYEIVTSMDDFVFPPSRRILKIEMLRHA